MKTLTIISSLVLLLSALVLTSCQESAASPEEPQPVTQENKSEKYKAAFIQYLEIVTPKVDETCKALSEVHGLVFGEPIPGFGNARVGEMSDGGRIGVRGPMRPDEAPVVRPYILTKDIDAAVKKAAAAGAKIAMQPMEIPDQGRFAIYILGGIDHGLWQL